MNQVRCWISPLEGGKVDGLGTFPDEVEILHATLPDGNMTTYPVELNVFAHQFSKTAQVPLTFSFTVSDV